MGRPEVKPAGEALREAMEARGFSANELARRLLVHRRKISDILDGTGRITPWFAVGFERVMGQSQDYWMECQRLSDASETE